MLVNDDEVEIELPSQPDVIYEGKKLVPNKFIMSMINRFKRKKIVQLPEHVPYMFSHYFLKSLNKEFNIFF